MNNTFDQYEFECTLMDIFEDVNLERTEITKEINKRLVEDPQFKQDYETWMDETGYESWKPYLKTLEDEYEMAKEEMYPDGENEE